jgi:hypothetical protein
MEESLRTSHLPDLFRDLVNRLRNPLPGTALLSPGAPAHGILRRRQGYTAAMLVEEFSDAGGFDLLRPSHYRPPDRLQCAVTARHRYRR